MEENTFQASMLIFEPQKGLFSGNLRLRGEIPRRRRRDLIFSSNKRQILRKVTTTTGWRLLWGRGLKYRILYFAGNFPFNFLLFPITDGSSLKFRFYDLCKNFSKFSFAASLSAAPSRICCQIKLWRFEGSRSQGKSSEMSVFLVAHFAEKTSSEDLKALQWSQI